MVTHATLDYLSGLKACNTREWFEAHRREYESASADFFDTVAHLISSIASFDEEIAEARPDPKSCIMRIYRDVRFSKDKTPYKTGFFAYICKGGKKSPFAGYYLHCEPGGSFIGGGLYMPEPAILAMVRQAIDSRYEEWHSIVTNQEMIAQFQRGVLPSGETKRPPKGYDASNPALHYLRFKGYYTQRFFSDGQLLDEGFVETVADSCRTVRPMVAFLNEAIGVR
jgi:uncharacterized protein (TIGR02453 family)